MQEVVCSSLTVPSSIHYKTFGKKIKKIKKIIMQHWVMTDKVLLSLLLLLKQQMWNAYREVISVNFFFSAVYKVGL